MPLFGKSQKTPVELVKSLKEAINALEAGDRKVEKAQEDVSKNLVSIKNMLYGSSDAEPPADYVVAQLSQELYNSNLLLLLIQNLHRIDFEGKKHVALIFNNVLREDWHTIAHSGIHMHETGNSVYTDGRLRGCTSGDRTQFGDNAARVCTI